MAKKFFIIEVRTERFAYLAGNIAGAIEAFEDDGLYYEEDITSVYEVFSYAEYERKVSWVIPVKVAYKNG